MRLLRQSFAAWQHGVAILVVYGLSLLVVGFGFLLVMFAVNALLGMFGAGIDEDRLASVMLMLSPLWVPLGLGYAARWNPTETINPEKA